MLADSQTGLCCAFFLHDVMIELSLPRRCVLQISSMEADVSAADDVEALIRAHRKLFVKLPLEAVLPLPPASPATAVDAVHSARFLHDGFCVLEKVLPLCF